MTDDALDILDSATVFQAIVCEGGVLVVGTLWEKFTDEEDGQERLIPRSRLHVATSDAQAAKLLKDYLAQNRSEMNGVLDE